MFWSFWLSNSPGVSQRSGVFNLPHLFFFGNPFQVQTVAPCPHHQGRFCLVITFFLAGFFFFRPKVFFFSPIPLPPFFLPGSSGPLASPKTLSFPIFAQVNFRRASPSNWRWASHNFFYPYFINGVSGFLTYSFFLHSRSVRCLPPPPPPSFGRPVSFCTVSMNGFFLFFPTTRLTLTCLRFPDVHKLAHEQRFFFFLAQILQNDYNSSPSLTSSSFWETTAQLFSPFHFECHPVPLGFFTNCLFGCSSLLFQLMPSEDICPPIPL